MRQEDDKLKASLGCIARAWLHSNNKKKKTKQKRPILLIHSDFYIFIYMYVHVCGVTGICSIP